MRTVSGFGSVLADGVGVSVWLGGADVDFFSWGDWGHIELGADSVDHDDPGGGFAGGAGCWLSEVCGSGWFEFGHGVWWVVWGVTSGE